MRVGWKWCYLKNMYYKLYDKSWTVPNDRGIDNIRFKIFGDGPLKVEFEDFAKSLNVNAIFV